MEDIKNKEIYLTKMSKTFFDKAWFMSHIPEGIDTFIDFGCADGLSHVLYHSGFRF